MASRWRNVGWSLAACLGLVLGGAMVALSLIDVATGATASGASSSLVVERRAMGPRNAKVQIVVYNDFQCPHCYELHRAAEPEIIERYVRTGLARLEVRQFAVMGPESVMAAEASLCAADQGRFWEYRDALFSAWRQKGYSAYSEAGVRAVADQVGLDRDAFGSCLVSGARLAEVEEDMRRGKAEGITAVPSVFINGRQVVGTQPFQVYAKIIDEELEKELAK